MGLYKIYSRVTIAYSLYSYCCQKSYIILINNITTYSDPKFLEMNATIRRDKQTADLYVTVQNVLPLHNLTFELLMKPPSESNYTTLIKRSLPFCDFAMGKHGDPILKMIYEEFTLRGVQFLSKCPTPVVRTTFCICIAK